MPLATTVRGAGDLQVAWGFKSDAHELVTTKRRMSLWQLFKKVTPNSKIIKQVNLSNKPNSQEKWL